MLPLYRLRMDVYSYKESKEGYYFLFHAEVEDRPITNGDVILFVDRNKRGRLLEQEVTKRVHIIVSSLAKVFRVKLTGTG